MSGSFVIYKKHDFEAHDVDLQIWLHFVLKEIEEEVENSVWKDEIVDDWKYQSTAGLIGTVSPYLDKYAQDERHRRQLIECSEKALRRLREEERIDRNALKSSGVGGRVVFYEDVPTARIADIGEKFVKLLKGEFDEFRRAKK